MPSIPGKACGISDAMRASTAEEPNEFYTRELVDEYGANPIAQNLLDTARTLEGVARHASTHAAGSADAAARRGAADPARRAACRKHRIG